MMPAQTLSYDGIEQPISEWALDYGITPAIIIGRLERGMTIADAITTPMKVGHARQRLPVFSRKQIASAKRGGRLGKTYTYNNQRYLLSELSELTGVPVFTLRKRIADGWPMEQALSTPTLKQRRRGVVFNLDAFEGTGAGSTPQATASENNFSESEACPQ